MPTSPVSNHLADVHYVTAVVRLATNGRGQLLHGEVVDLQAQSIGRFVEWARLTQILRTWLRNQAQDIPSDQR